MIPGENGDYLKGSIVKFKLSPMSHVAFLVTSSNMFCIMFYLFIAVLFAGNKKYYYYFRLCTSNSFENGDFWQTCPHSRRHFTPIFLDSQILSHWYHFEAQLVGNNIWRKIGILSTEILAILICIYKSEILVIRFSSHTIQRTKSPPQGHLALRKYSSKKSY